MKDQFKRVAILFAATAFCTQGQWLNYPTPGTPRTRDGKPELSAKAPRASNGKPDLSGVWRTEFAPPGENERLFGADVKTFAPALNCITAQLGEGGRHGPYKAYEWNKMKTPTRILVGGPEVTSAFVLMGLALARKRMASS